MTAWPSREELESTIASGLTAYDDAVRAEWQRIRIEPAKWQCSPWADETGGFWAVAIDGGCVLWFNDIEEGFNWSRYSTRGTIDDYFCSQTKLVWILEQIAQRNSERARARLDEGDVPAQIAGPGTIEVRQTTYWEVRSRAAARYRIHFRDKAEVGFTDAGYPTVEIRDEHPLLVQYNAPTQSLYFYGTPLRPRSIAEELERAIRADSESWRGLFEYGGNSDAVERTLRARHGKLMDAPAPVCAIAARVLENEGVQCSIVDNAPARSGMRVLLLGRSYVVARGFSFEVRRGEEP